MGGGGKPSQPVAYAAEPNGPAADDPNAEHEPVPKGDGAPGFADPNGEGLPCVAAMEDASNGDTLVPAAPNGDAVAAAPKGDTDLLFIDACDPAETPSLESLAAPPSDDSPAVPAVLNGEDAANVPSCPAPVEGNTVGAPPNGDILTSAEEVAAPPKGDCTAALATAPS